MQNKTKDMKMEITLIREDMLDSKKNTPINEINLLSDFKQEAVTAKEIYRADTITFKDDDNSVILKSRY
jgi:hypothetical protein